MLNNYPHKILDHLRKLYPACVTALMIAALQVSLVWVVSGENNWLDAFQRLTQRDSLWYIDIANRGYQHDPVDLSASTIEVGNNNVAFFPGYPLVIRLVSQVFGIPSEIALYIASQIACWLFWLQFLLFMERWAVPLSLRILGSLAVAVYPTAFFLVVGYSESLFLSTLLGYLYWSRSNCSVGWVLAGLSGCLMTATRIVGLPLIGLPILKLLRIRFANGVPLFDLDIKGFDAKWFLTSLIAGLGGLSFFFFCAIQFGDWNLYLKLQQMGWEVTPDYKAFFQWQHYIPSGQMIQEFFWLVEDRLSWADRLSKLAVAATFWALWALSVLDWGICLRNRRIARPERFDFFLIAWTMFYFTVTGLASVGMRSMIRYCFPIYVLLVLAVIHLATNFINNRIKLWRKRVYLQVAYQSIVASLFFIAGFIQVYLIWRYAQHIWVA
ncbi:MAG: hypothetical protein NW237_17155 [Cyanobacteriota bacterium]|nr:hypothetical protein [Cyanobacteriota bacterium]